MPWDVSLHKINAKNYFNECIYWSNLYFMLVVANISSIKFFFTNFFQFHWHSSCIKPFTYLSCQVSLKTINIFNFFSKAFHIILREKKDLLHRKFRFLKMTITYVIFLTSYFDMVNLLLNIKKFFKLTV